MPESWSSRYISESIRKNALKCRTITSLEAKQLNEYYHFASFCVFLDL